MLHRLLCRLYFHTWTEWEENPVSTGQFTTRIERTCKCCGAQERRRYYHENY